MPRFTRARVRAALPLALVASLAGMAALTSAASANLPAPPTPILQPGTPLFGVVGTLGDVLNARTAPTTSSALVVRLSPRSAFSIACQTTGSLVRNPRWDPKGSRVWDRIILYSPDRGRMAAYVSDVYVGTPVTNAPTDALHGYKHGIPSCKNVRGLALPRYTVSRN
ncbi:MAG TPA: hypothetical protein VN635_10550 [Conexibacter sp.]|nr:hypothetical protein [Conexibacter sp.]